MEAENLPVRPKAPKAKKEKAPKQPKSSTAPKPKGTGAAKPAVDPDSIFKVGFLSDVY